MMYPDLGDIPSPFGGQYLLDCLNFHNQSLRLILTLHSFQGQVKVLFPGNPDLGLFFYIKDDIDFCFLSH